MLPGLREDCLSLWAFHLDQSCLVVNLYAFDLEDDLVIDFSNQEEINAEFDSNQCTNQVNGTSWVEQKQVDQSMSILEGVTFWYIQNSR